MIDTNPDDMIPQSAPEDPLPAGKTEALQFRIDKSTGKLLVGGQCTIHVPGGMDEIERLGQAIWDTELLRDIRKERLTQEQGQAAGVGALGAKPCVDMPMPSKKNPKRRMSVVAANAKAMELAKKMGKDFLLLSGRTQARKIGCSWQTWTKTKFYQTAQQKKKRIAEQMAQGRQPGSPPTVSLTNKLEAAAAEEAFERLRAEQQADREPSPVDDSRTQVLSRKRL